MLLQLLLAVGLVAKATGTCSYSDTSLTNWNSTESWDTGVVPVEKDKAVIKSGKHVLLNVSPKSLKGLTIENGGSLVWGNFDDLVLTTDFVHVKGKFIIGDSDCPFEKKANIKLTGKSNTGNTVTGFGSKVIGVDNGGTIELHGAEKKSWTKLVKTVKPAADQCGFNFKDSTYNLEQGKGLFIAVFNLDGSVFDFNVVKTQSSVDTEAENKFKTYIEEVPTGKVLAVAVNSDLGTGTVVRTWKTIYETLESVGGITRTDLRKVQGQEAFAFITKKGDTSTTKEQYVANPGDAETLSTDYLTYHETTTDMVFSVQSVVHPNGRNKGVNFQVLGIEVANPVISLNDDVTSWKKDDKIIVASTDFDWEQVEEFSLLDCADCDENEVKLDHPFEYMHFGEITENVDEMAEVGLLTRTIKIEGVMEDSCYEYDAKDTWLCEKFKEDTYGGHVKMRKGFVAAHIENVELVNMGQQKFIGSYALHFHMCDDVEGNYFRHNSIHKCHSRCITIHGSDKSEASDNVCYQTKGHSIFLEDSAEQWNIIDGNLVIGTRHGSHLLTDMKEEWVNSSTSSGADALSSYWLTHPVNYIRNNVAAGSDNVGFWYVAAEKPLGPSGARQLERQLVTKDHAIHSEILQFENNTAHSNKGRGLRTDGRLANKDDPNGRMENAFIPIIFSNNPREGASTDGNSTVSYMKNFRAYKNRNQNVWTKSGSLVMDHFTIADAPRSIASARSDPIPTFVHIKNSLFIGETANVGKPEEPFNRSMAFNDAEEALQGFEFYQGPVYLTNSFFDKFEHKWSDDITRVAGAISFKRDATYPSAANSGVKNITFGFCDSFTTNWVFQGNASVGEWGTTDGNNQASFRDYDGSVTGTAGSQVVQNHRFFTTDRCLRRESWGNLTVCPHEYARALFEGVNGVFKSRDSNYAISLRRDDRPEDILSLSGIRKDNYLVLKNYSYTVYFNGSAPKEMSITYENLHRYDYVRLGLCFPKDSVFTITGRLPRINGQNPAIEKTSIADLDADTTGRAYFWDQSRGLLFVHGIGQLDEINKEKCPGQDCVKMTITRTGSTTPIDCYEDAYGDGTYNKTADTTTTIPTIPTCKTGSGEGYGAPAIPPKYTATAITPTCPSSEPSTSSNEKGCYVDSPLYMDLPHSMVELSGSLTVNACVTRCYQRNYAYAGMNNGRYCSCGNYYGALGEAEGECTKDCPGQDGKKCGESRRNTVYSTGIAAPSALPTCGENDSGVEINDRCYQITDTAETFTGAQRDCVKLGANLATITSQSIQDNVEIYLRDNPADVWFGLNDIDTEGTRKYVDGTTDTTFDNTIEGEGDKSNEDGFILQQNTIYRWNDRAIGNKYKGLCESDIGSSAPTGVACGQNDAGKKFGNGKCYAVINTKMNKLNARYACYTRMGKLVSVNSNNEAEVLKHVFVYGEDKDYWTDDVDSDDKVLMLEYANMYKKKATFISKEYGVVCELDIVSSTERCGSEWTLSGDTCYLYKGDSIAKMTEARALCQQGDSDILTIESEQEATNANNYVHAEESTVYHIGYKYTSGSGYSWVDGTTGTYTNWQNNNGPDFASSKGKCAKVKSLTGSWKNNDCTASGTVVCKAPAA